MKNYILLAFAVIFLYSCNATKKIGIGETSGLKLEIIKSELIEPNSDFNFLIDFKVTNDTNKDVWLPNPKNPSGYDIIESPEFFFIRVGRTGEVYHCSYSDYYSKSNDKKITDYTKMQPGESKLFSINPKKLHPSMFCEVNTGSVDLQVVYMTLPHIVKNIELPEEVMNNLLIGTFESQIVTFNID